VYWRPGQAATNWPVGLVELMRRTKRIATSSPALSRHATGRALCQEKWRKAAVSCWFSMLAHSIRVCDAVSPGTELHSRRFGWAKLPTGWRRAESGLGIATQKLVARVFVFSAICWFAGAIWRFRSFPRHWHNLCVLSDLSMPTRKAAGASGHALKRSRASSRPTPGETK